MSGYELFSSGSESDDLDFVPPSEGMFQTSSGSGLDTKEEHLPSTNQIIAEAFRTKRKGTCQSIRKWLLA